MARSWPPAVHPTGKLPSAQSTLVLGAPDVHMDDRERVLPGWWTVRVVDGVHPALRQWAIGITGDPVDLERVALGLQLTEGVGGRLVTGYWPNRIRGGGRRDCNGGGPRGNQQRREGSRIGGHERRPETPRAYFVR